MLYIKDQFWGGSDSTAGRMLALNMADLDSFPGILYAKPASSNFRTQRHDMGNMNTSGCAPPKRDQILVSVDFEYLMFLYYVTLYLAYERKLYIFPVSV